MVALDAVSKRKLKERNDPDWQQLEARIGELYRSLGFHVDMNMEVAGQQVDVLATKMIEGLGLTTVVVECKHSKRAPISNQIVQDFISSIAAMRDRENITKGVIVTNLTFSPKAKEVAMKAGSVDLITTRDLEQQAFHSVPAYERFIAEYQDDEIYRSYLALRGTQYTNSGYGPEIEDVDTAITGWLQHESISLVSVLGDYGTGKTTLLQRLRYNLARDYVAGETSLKPVFVKLKDYVRYKTVDGLLVAAILENFYTSITLPTFKRGMYDGHFILLLDGFDEMEARAGANKRRENLVMLGDLLHGKCKAVLTCRPSYFVTHDEYVGYVRMIGEQLAPGSLVHVDALGLKSQTRVAELEELHVELYKQFGAPKDVATHADFGSVTLGLLRLNTDQIKSFLKTFEAQFRTKCRCSADEVLRFLLTVYDLSDLMTRPILLHMIVTTVLSGKIDIGGKGLKFGPSSLYDLYTNIQFDRDWNKGLTRQLISRIERKEFAVAIALAMYDSGRLAVAYEEILQFAGHGGPVSSTKSMLNSGIRKEELATDIQICAFLTRQQDGMFRFTHKSFMEFFVALRLKDCLVTNKGIERLNAELPKEILYFIGGFTYVEQSLRGKMISILEGVVDNRKYVMLASNLAAALFYADKKVSGLRFDNLESYQLALVGTSMNDVVFRKPTFIRADWRNVDFTNCYFHEAILDECQFTSLTLTNSLFETICSGKCSDLSARTTRVALSGDGFDLHNAVFRDCETVVQGRVSMSDCKIIGGQYDACTASSHIVLSDVEFSDVSIQCTLGLRPDVVARRVVLRRCNIMGLMVSSADIISNIEFVDCTGYVLVYKVGSMENVVFPDDADKDRLLVLPINLRTFGETSVKRYKRLLEKMGIRYLDRLLEQATSLDQQRRQHQTNDSKAVD